MKVLTAAAVAAFALWVPLSAAAQSAQAFKLIVRWQGAGIAITDYPSRARCEAGRDALLREIARQFPMRPPQALPSGGTIYSQPVIIDAICFMG